MDDKCGSDLISLKELVLLSLALIRYSLNVVNPQVKSKTFVHVRNTTFLMKSG